MKEPVLERRPVWVLLIMAALTVAGLLVVDVYLQNLEVGSALQAKQAVPTDSTQRTKRREQDTIRLCDPGYPGPGGKDDCVTAKKKLLANPQYIKQI